MDALVQCSCIEQPIDNPGLVYFSLQDLYFCEECSSIRCPRCVVVDIVSLFCPSCLVEYPASHVSKGSCSQGCIRCPYCAFTLQNEFSLSSSSSSSSSSSKKICPQCVYEYTVSRGNLTGAAITKEIENSQKRSPKMTYFRSIVSALDECTFLSMSKPAILKAPTKLKESSSSSPLKHTPFPVPITDVLNMDYPYYANQLIDAHDPDHRVPQPQLVPLKPHLRKRCPECRRILASPVTLSSKSKHNIQLLAPSYLPLVIIDKDSLSINPQRARLTVINPLEGDIEVTLVVNHHELSISQFTVGAFVEVWDIPTIEPSHFDPEMRPIVPADPNTALIQAGNKSSVFIDLSDDEYDAKWRNVSGKLIFKVIDDDDDDTMNGSEKNSDHEENDLIQINLWIQLPSTSFEQKQGVAGSNV